MPHSHWPALALALAGASAPPSWGDPPDRPAALAQVRLCFSSRGEDGIAACRGALALGLGPGRLDQVQVSLATRLAARQRWPEAALVHRAAVALRPEDAKAQLRLGASLVHALHRPEEALHHLEQATRLGPGEADAWGTLAVALSAVGRPAESVAAFEQALRLDPAYLEVRSGSRQVLEAARRGESWPAEPGHSAGYAAD